jgi:hypothetical protein
VLTISTWQSFTEKQNSLVEILLLSLTTILGIIVWSYNYIETFKYNEYRYRSSCLQQWSAMTEGKANNIIIRVWKRHSFITIVVIACFVQCHSKYIGIKVSFDIVRSRISETLRKFYWVHYKFKNNDVVYIWLISIILIANNWLTILIARV